MSHQPVTGVYSAHTVKTAYDPLPAAVVIARSRRLALAGRLDFILSVVGELVRRMGVEVRSILSP